MATETRTRVALEAAVQALTPTSDTARLEAEVLLAHVLGQPRHRPYAWPEERLHPEAHRRFQTLLGRRIAGEPLAYLTGQREFWSLELKVTPQTLIPRPDTERLVEVALALIPKDISWQIADLGTGSGAVALALAKERPYSQVTATDIVPEALAVAQCNAYRLGLSNVAFALGHWCDALPTRPYHLIVSNPPYVPDYDPHFDGELRFEPRVSLMGGLDGLASIRDIVRYTPSHLRRDGRLLLEHGYDQGRPVWQLMQRFGYRALRGHWDYSGHLRVTQGTAP